MNKINNVIFALIISGFATAVLADVPQTISSGHGHAIMASGKVTLFRVQEAGLRLGSGEDVLDAEVLVTLDTKPGQVFGIKLDSNPANREMVETLRTAFLKGTKITLEHQFAGQKNNLKINWVQLGEMPTWAEAQ